MKYLVVVIWFGVVCKDIEYLDGLEDVLEEVLFDLDVMFSWLIKCKICVRKW